MILVPALLAVIFVLIILLGVLLAENYSLGIKAKMNLAITKKLDEVEYKLKRTQNILTKFFRGVSDERSLPDLVFDLCRDRDALSRSVIIENQKLSQSMEDCDKWFSRCLKLESELRRIKRICKAKRICIKKPKGKNGAR